MTQQVDDGIGDRFCVLGRHEPSVHPIGDQVGHTTHSSRHDRAACRHRFDRGERRALVIGRNDEDVQIGVDSRQVRAPASKLNSIPNAQLAGLLF